MTLALYDRVQQTGTANTTVSFTLSGSVAGYQSFVAVGNGNTTYYGSFDTSGNWEVGLGTYSTTGPTLTRTTILSSSNGGLAVTFSGTVNVFITYPSEKSVNQDANGNVTLANDASISGLTVGRGGGAVASNTVVGNGAMAATATGANNSAFGYDALTVNTSGASNNAFGLFSLFGNTTGSSNVGIGTQSLFANTTGSSNVALGTLALQANTTASNNTAVGYQAGYSNTTGQYGTFLGQQAGFTNSVGSYNTFVGYLAGYTSNFNGNAYNTCLGYVSGQNLSTGTINTFLGAGAGQLITTGSKNTIIGNYGGNSGGLDIRTASNNIVLSDGDGNPRGLFDNSGKFWVSTSFTSSLIATNAVGYYTKPSDGGFQRCQNANTSDWSISATSGTICNFYSWNGSASVYSGAISVNGNITTYGSISDYRLKENIAPITGALDTVAKLKPVTFDFKNSGQKSQGFIAHELQAVVPEAVTGEKDAVDAEGKPVYQGVDTSFLVATLTAAIQELNAKVTALEAGAKA